MRCNFFCFGSQEKKRKEKEKDAFFLTLQGREYTLLQTTKTY